MTTTDGAPSTRPDRPARPDRAAAPPAEFDLLGELPTGTWLLEASAGTGKTYTIAGLVVRHVAEGAARLDELLVLTFGRAASAELRSRVRGALAAAERTLAASLGAADEGTPPPAPTDGLLRHLLDAPVEELRRRHVRVRDALADVDTATIATTHQFCQLVLASLGVAGDADPGAELREDLDDVLVETVDDLYVRGFARSADRPDLDRRTALAVARRAVADPQASLWAPEVAEQARPSEQVRARRTRFALAARRELERRKRRLRVLSFDDLLTRLAAALQEPDSLARRRVRERWSVVLVDEFQDTDPVQWQVLSRAFVGHATMVLVGDPKQAIYAFRGGDVQTYLAAAGECDHRATLATSYRSDAALVASLDAVLVGAHLGDPAIAARPLTAHHAGPRLVGAPVADAFRLRVLDRARAGGGADTLPPVYRARGAVHKDLAAEVVTLLGSGATFDGEPVRPADVGVLCRTSFQCEDVRRALDDAGVRAVTGGGGDGVLHTEAADHWLRLLEALVAPQRTNRVRAAATTVFLGRSPEELVAGGDELSERLADEVRDLAVLAGRRGVAGVLERLVTDHDVYARVLARDDGERLVTDLRHVAEVLHDVGVRDRLALPSLAAWLRRQREDDRGGAGEERARRLDSDTDAVQVMTIHGAKGLEFPVVMLPSVSDHFVREEDFPLFHDEHGARRLDVGGAPFPREVLDRSAAEQAGEELRLLYVAMTRAQSQLVAWWAPTKTHTAASPLHRLLLGRTQHDGEVPPSAPVRRDEDVQAWLAQWQKRGGPVVELVGPARELRREVERPAGELRARPWERTVDQQWRRTSYSALTSAAEALELGATTPPPPVSEPEVPLRDDEEGPTVPVDVAQRLGDLDVDDVPSPLQGQPGGAAYGSLVHAVLEHLELDGTDPDDPVALRALLGPVVAEQVELWPVPGVTKAALVEGMVDGLAEVLRAPLGPLLPGVTLASLPGGDQLAELDFEIPLAGGDGLGGGSGALPGHSLAALADLLRGHLDVDDPLREFAERLERPGYVAQQLRGYLSGSLDLVLRHDGRYLVADYKTNLLGDDVATDSAAAYAPDRLRAAMLASTYPLQALLYAVVLHRYLRWRLPGYDPATHLGGVLYLYVRGMCGPGTPVVDGHPTGVFSWSPPASLVVATSDLLAGLDLQERP